MTRYFLTLKQAIKLLFKACEASYGGETFVMQMPACRMIDLAEVIVKHFGNDETKIAEIGKRVGEKTHEVLISRYESSNTFIFDENYYVVFPMIQIDGLRDFYESTQRLVPVSFEEYASNQEIMNPQEIEDLLSQGGFFQS